MATESYFEIRGLLTQGTVNPWGHDWDRHGELFFINTVNGHLWHSVTGAHLVEPILADTPEIPRENILAEPLSRNTAQRHACDAPFSTPFYSRNADPSPAVQRASRLRVA